MARRRSRPKFSFDGRGKWLLALIVLAVGVAAGAQIGRWTMSDQASEVARRSLQGSSSPAVKKTAPRPAAQPAVKATSAARPAGRTVPAERAEHGSTAYSTDAVKPSAALPAAAVRHGSGPIVAIVLDDWGYNTSALGTALEIDQPLTLAVLPHLPYSARVAEQAHAAGHEVMLHMPMEPMGDVPLEPGTLLTGMSSGEIRSLLSSALASVPHVRGVNNHMGSKGTQDRPMLQAVMTELKRRELFFLNSMTSGSSAGREVAGDLRIPYAERDIFLDNVRTEAAVLEKLEELRQAAVRQGSAIGIGHDKPVTLKAIQKVLPSWEAQGIRLMKLSDLIRHHAEGD